MVGNRTDGACRTVIIQIRIFGALIHAYQGGQDLIFLSIGRRSLWKLYLLQQAFYGRGILFKIVSQLQDYIFDSFFSDDGIGVSRQSYRQIGADRFQQTDEIIVNRQGVYLEYDDRKGRDITGTCFVSPVTVHLNRHLGKRKMGTSQSGSFQERDRR